MPFVPTTGSRMNPAIVCGPSNMITSSSSRRLCSTGSGSGRAHLWLSGTRTTPHTPFSAAQRRGSPVAAMTPPVAPWYERYRARIFWRPVTCRASLMAFSFASAPPPVKKLTSISPGRISASFWPSRARGSWAMKGLA